MNLNKILVAVMLLPLLLACQSEPMQDNGGTDVNLPKHKLRVTASIPSSDNTRAHITYGNQDEERELFKWDVKEEICIINLNKLDKYVQGIQMEVVEVSEDGHTAILESETFTENEFAIEKGDVLWVISGQVNRYGYKEDPNALKSPVIYDERGIFNIGVGTEANKPQYIEKNPTDASLEYMKDNIRYYDIVTATEDGKVPDLHIKHMSSIFRVTLRNETGEDIYPTKIEMEFPGIEGGKPFFNTSFYCSVVGDAASGFKLKSYEDDVFFNGSLPYTDHIGTTINGKEGTNDAGEKILNGESYDLYIATIPRIGGVIKANSIKISLIASHLTDTPYTITIPGFTPEIEPGMRYWFKLTATPEHTLMLSSQWDALHKDQNKDETEDSGI